jgi:tripartite-type tricarboxylate transporter receptor subunit TctC
MMFKILLTFLLLINTSAFATQTVSSVWAFNIANLQGSYYRALLEQANKNQKTYLFVPESRPGAGGSIGAIQVVNNEKLSLLGTAAAFFVRPYLYDNAGYTFDQFKPVYLIANSPVALTTKHKDLKTILSQSKISIGTAGPGSGTHLFALKFKENHPDKEILVVPYKSSTEALQDVLGGHIDLAYEFLGDAEAKGVKILGVTGTVKIKNYPLMKDIGYANNAELTGVYHILVKKDVPDAVVKELREIFNQAEKSVKFQELYKSDYSFKPALATDKDYDTWYTNTIKTYRALITKDMKIE